MKPAIKRSLILIPVFLVFASLLSPRFSAEATAVLTVEPITWDVIGLDSNNVNVGPNNFPVGVRVCNSGPDPATDVTATFAWDDGNNLYTGHPYINLRSGSLSSITRQGSLAVGVCADFYFEATVGRNLGAYDQSRRYHIDVASDEGDAATSPEPRELYVEYLISQSRNSTTDIQLDGDSIAPGGTMVLMVGSTYDITLYGSTATNGYEQIETFINFPNTIFQINSVSTTYTANDTGSPDPDADTKLYADGCSWENDPDSPNYRSCLDIGKYGGDVVVTYNVTIIGGGGTSETLNSLIYDFSGSSYHYNSDFSLNGRIAKIVNASIDKSFSPKTITPGGDSTLTFTLTNPGTSTISNINFTDLLPADLDVPTSSSPQCSGTLTTTDNDPSPDSIALSGASLASGETCTFSVTITASTAADGLYTNTTNHLFIGTDDTGDDATDYLQVTSLPPAPDTCDPAARVTLATWDFSTGTGSTIPPGADVDYADATYSTTGTSTVTGGYWLGTGWVENDNPTPPPPTSSDTHFQFDIDTSNYGNVDILFDARINANGNWTGANNNLRVWQSADTAAFSLAGTDNTDLSTTWTPYTRVADDTGVSHTRFRIQGYYAKKNNTPDAEVWLDNVVVSGCPRPDPPELDKTFGTDPIAEGSTSTLTFTLSNPNASALTGVAFSDTVPTGLKINTPNGLSETCSFDSSLITADEGTSTISLSGATLTASETCAVSIDILGNAAGYYTNISNSITSDETGPNTTVDGYGEDDLTVIAPPVITKAFGNNPILTGDSTSLTFAIYNPNILTNTTLAGVSFTDNLPAGLVVATPNGLTGNCGGGGITATAGSSVVSLSAATLAGGASCTFSVNVTGATTGLKQNSVTVSSTNGGAGNTASANVLVRDSVASLAFLKQVGSTASGPWSSFLTLAVNDPVHYRFVIENTGDQNLTTVDIAETVAIVPAGLDVSNCAWEDGDGDSLSAPFTLPTADASDDDHIAYCVLSSVVAQVGSHTNTAEADSDQTSPVEASATYATTGLSLVKSVAESYFTSAGETMNYSFVVTNSGYAPLEGPVTVDDNLATDESCPAVSTATQTSPPGPGDGDNWLDPGEKITCTASYVVQAADVTAGDVTNIASATTDGVTSPTDTETVYLAALTIDKDTSTATVGVDGVVSYTIVVVNTGGVALTNFQVSDTSPFASGEFSVGSVAAPGFTVNGSYDGLAAGDTNLLAGTDTLALGATATITINLQLISAATTTYDNTAVAITDETGSVDDDGVVANDPGTPGGGADPETDEDVTVIAGGTITVVKDAEPDAAQDFTYTGSGPSGYNFGGGFNLDDDADGTLPNTQIFSNLTPGNYSLTEAAASGWSLTGLVCVDPDSGSSVDVGVRTATIDLDAGETVTCTYTNTQQNPALNIVKEVGASATGPWDDTSITVSVGDEVYYRITVENTGNVALTGISVSDPEVDTSGCTWSDPLGVSGTTSCVVGPVTAVAGTQTNTATADSNETGADTDGAQYQASAALVTDPAVTKTGDPATAAIGDTVVFTIVVENLGDNTATNVRILDNVPLFLTVTNVTSVPAASVDNSTGNIVDLTYATVDPGDVYTITVTTIVNSSATPPSVTNTANLTADVDDNTSNNSDSEPITIVVVSDFEAPETGFAPRADTEIPAQSAERAYERYGELSLRIPTLGVNASIVGVPLLEDGWDVTWLWNQVGYLDGTAFPGWDGNSVLTSHVYLPNGLPGPFVNLKLLKWGDRIIVESYGTRYSYEVRDSELVSPDDSSIIHHEETPWLTLITCQGYEESSDSYRWRRVVRAVLIETTTESGYRDWRH